MNAVLDASTIITLVKRRGEQAVDALEGSTTLALAPYEIGNALRTETQLTKTLPEKEADRLLYILYRLLTVLSLEAPATADDAIEILAITHETGTSFYDASYLAEARKRRLPLATEDRRLAGVAAKNGIATITANDLCP